MPHRQLYLGPLTDNRRWDRIALRPGDVIVATPPKCGTTWMQIIIALLLSGDPEVEPALAVNMPWVDIRMRDVAEVADRLDAMTHRRSMKSHTPIDGLPLDPQARYICVFRHPIDAHFSFRKHIRNVPLPWYDHWFPEPDDGTAFARFLDGGPEGFDADAAPLAHILRHYSAARAVSDRPNVSLFHYADMTRDLPGTFAGVAAFLGVTHPLETMARLVAAASFEHMQAHAERYVPFVRTGAFKSDAAFFDSGSSGKWHGILSAAELAAYDALMDAQLAPEARRWLEFGDAP
jgi:aryl sulfotransferase